MTQSSIDPTQPAPYSEGLSSSVRNNFASAANDVNALWTAIGQNGPVLAAGLVLAGPVTGTAYSTFRALSASDIPNLSPSQITGLGSAALKNTTNVGLSYVAAVSGTINTGHVAVFSDGVGTVSDGGALGSMAYQNFTAVSITGGTIDGTVLGGTTAAAAHVTTLNASGAVIFADSSTWTASGLSCPSNNYTTVSTSVFNISPIWNFSSTSNGISALFFAPTVIPTGASAGNVNSTAINATAGASAVNILSFRGLSLGLTEASGYTGVIANASALLINGPNINGTNPITVYNGVTQGSVTNGNGLTTGTVTNTGYQINAITAAAGAGGTLNNTGIAIAMPSGTNAGTATNTGLTITGNGQTGGTVTNWAINSTSTANSQITGGLNNTPIGQVTAAAGSFTTITANAGASGAPATFSSNAQFGTMTLNVAFASGGPAAVFQAQGSRGTIGSLATLVTGDTAGIFQVKGYDGTSYRQMAALSVIATGTISTGIVPTILTVSTANSSGTLTEGSRMDAAQRWLIGYTADQGGGQKLQVNSGAFINGSLALGAAPSITPASGALSLVAAVTVSTGLTVGGTTAAAATHLEFHGTAPTAVVGTGSTIAGNDSAGRITAGTSPGTTVVITFANAWTNAPIGFAQNETTSMTMRLTSISTTSATFTASATINASDKISYEFKGYN